MQVTTSNGSIDFVAASGGPTIQATVTPGFYSLTSLMTAIAAAMNTADSANTYTVTADRTVSGGQQNRVTIATSSTFLSLLFGTGPRAASTIATLIGFTATDKTGATTYTGTSSAGTALISALNGYNYLSPDYFQTVNGNVNVSASGVKEAVVFQIMKFLTVQFKYETAASVVGSWEPFFQWAIQQRPFDFTPEITSPNTFYQVTLEKTAAESKGLGYKMTEMLPQFPFNYDTGLLTFRLVQ